MKSLYFFMEQSVISSKSELQDLINDLNTICQKVDLIQKDTPATPIAYKVHDALNAIRTKALAVREVIQKAIE